MTSAKNYKEKKTEQERGRKRYLERLIEEQEAEKEIQEYERDEPTEPGKDCVGRRPD